MDDPSCLTFNSRKKVSINWILFSYISRHTFIFVQVIERLLHYLSYAQRYWKLLMPCPALFHWLNFCECYMLILQAENQTLEVQSLQPSQNKLGPQHCFSMRFQWANFCPVFQLATFKMAFWHAADLDSIRVLHIWARRVATYDDVYCSFMGTTTMQNIFELLEAD